MPECGITTKYYKPAWQSGVIASKCRRPVVPCSKKKRREGWSLWSRTLKTSVNMVLANIFREAQPMCPTLTSVVTRDIWKNSNLLFVYFIGFRVAVYIYMHLFNMLRLLCCDDVLWLVEDGFCHKQKRKITTAEKASH